MPFRTSLLLCQWLLCSAAFAQSDQPSQPAQEAQGAKFPGATVADTLAELKKDPERVFAEHDGWLVAEKPVEGGSELWSFVPEGHEAYPSAVQRVITDGDLGLAIDMNIQCDATPSACEDLTTLFTVMNENLIGVSKNAPPIR